MKKYIFALQAILLIACSKKEDDPQPIQSKVFEECRSYSHKDTSVYESGKLIESFKLTETCDSVFVEFKLYPEKLKMRKPKVKEDLAYVEGKVPIQYAGTTVHNIIQTVLTGNNTIYYRIGYRTVYINSKLN